MSKSKLSLEEQIAKYTEKAQALKRRKEEADRRQRKANLDKIGHALDKLDFDLSDAALLTGCMAYALKAMQTTPGLDSEFKESGSKIIQSRKGANPVDDSSNGQEQQA